MSESEQFVELRSPKIKVGASLPEPLQAVEPIPYEILQHQGTQAFTYKILKPNEYVEESKTLQDTVIMELCEKGQRSFIIEKTESKLKEIRDGVHGITVGMFNSSGQLVGQSSINFEDLSKSPLYSQHGLRVPKNIKIFECTGVMIHPDYRSEGLSIVMNRHLMNFCNKVYETTDILIVAEIAVNNAPNLNVMINKLGFIARKKYTASDGVQCYLLYKPLGAHSSLVHFQSSGKADRIFDLSQQTEISSLLENGYSIFEVMPKKDESNKIIGTLVRLKPLSQQCYVSKSRPSVCIIL